MRTFVRTIKCFKARFPGLFEDSKSPGFFAHGVCRPGRDKLSEGKFQSFLPYFLYFTKSRKIVAARRRRGRGAAKGFSFVRAKLMFGWADSRFAEPRNSRQGRTTCHFLRCAKSDKPFPLRERIEVFQTSNQRTQTTTSCNLIKSCRKLFPTFCKAQKVGQKSLPAGSSPPLAAYIQKELPKQLLLYHHGRFSYPASVIAVLTSFKVG